jgi:uncharacterized protein (DUF2164 family)
MSQNSEANIRWLGSEKIAGYLGHFSGYLRQDTDPTLSAFNAAQSEQLSSRLGAMFSVYVVSELEAKLEQRMQSEANLYQGFSKPGDVFGGLPANAGIQNSDPGHLPTEPPLEIWNAFWVIRVAFTHGDGFLDRLHPRSQNLFIYAQSVFSANRSPENFMILPSNHAMHAHMARLRLTRALGTIDPWFQDTGF